MTQIKTDKNQSMTETGLNAKPCTRIGFKDSISSFTGNKSGNFAVIFAIGGLVLFSSVGAAVDLNILQKRKAYLQDTADHLVLMAARQNLSKKSDLTRLAKDYFALGGQKTSENIIITDFTKIEDQYKLTLSQSTRPQFANLLGVKSIDLNAGATAIYAKRDLDLALVLDNTGSMKGQKLSALKSASNNLIDILFTDNTKASQTKVGIVPFASWVNVGRSHRHDVWLDQKGVSPQNQAYFDKTVSRFDLYRKLNKSWNGCVENRLPPFDVTDTAPDPTNPKTLYQPAFHPDMTDHQFSGYSYVADRRHGSFMQKLRHTNKYQQALPRWSLGPTQVADTSCSDPRRVVTSLTSNPSHLKQRIQAMYAQGYTNIANGAGWGFRLVSPHAPFTQARPYGRTSRKAIVILTDGAQTMGGKTGAFKSGYSPYGFLGEPVISGQSRRLNGKTVKKALDQKLVQTCQAAKEKGVIVYTISFDLKDAPTQSMMRNCATSSGHYFDVKQAAQLSPAFEAIAAQLGDLRVTH